MTVKQPVSREIWQLQQEQICVAALQTSGAGNRLLLPLFRLLEPETDFWCQTSGCWNWKQIRGTKIQDAKDRCNRLASHIKVSIIKKFLVLGKINSVGWAGWCSSRHSRAVQWIILNYYSLVYKIRINGANYFSGAKRKILSFSNYKTVAKTAQWLMSQITYRQNPFQDIPDDQASHCGDLQQ